MMDMKEYIKRNLEAPLKRALDQFPVILVTGPRQAGKSTLLQHVLKDYNYVSLDNVLVRNLAESDPALFLKSYQSPVIIDEIQYVPSLLSYIKMQVDADRRNYGQFVLTGSQIFSLMKRESESLAGRIGIFHLYPLSWSEITSVNPYDEMAMFDQMLKGFYPEFQIAPKLEPEFWHNSYLSTYLERDLRVMRDIKDLGQFQKFITLLATRAAQLFNLTEIGKECGITQTTAKDWLTLLQASSIIHLLQPYSKNMTKRIIKSPKLYFIDTGLLCFLFRIETTKQLMNSPFVGHIFENMVIMDKIKNFAEKGKRAPCYFYRDSSGIEVDLLIDHGSESDIYEIKLTSSPKTSMTDPLKKFQKDHKVRNASILSLYKDKIFLSKNVTTQHWFEKI